MTKRNYSYFYASYVLPEDVTSSHDEFLKVNERLYIMDHELERTEMNFRVG